jgi:hypothetical protein
MLSWRPGGAIIEVAMIKIFDKDNGPDAGDQFKEWCRKNPDGFYLNPRPKGAFMLHVATCPAAEELEPDCSCAAEALLARPART